ncbi:MAG: hypothetical protein Q8876_10235 [Bacillota bacterium]|nr:hypothetical protein [Bacillota bacterium]
MDISEKLLYQQLISNAEQQGEALAKTIQHLSSEDETRFLKFIDGLYYFYELMDSRQFVDLLILLGDAYDIPHLSKDAIKTDKVKADAYISDFMEAFFYAALSIISNLVN